MKIRLTHAAELGPLVKAVRKAHGMRQDATADGVGVSENFLGKLERGGDTVQWGKLFSVMRELGIHVEVDIPDAAAKQLRKPPTADSP